jgi:hypothetical protein
MILSDKKGRRIIAGLVFLLVMMPALAPAHTLYMNVMDNGDGTVTVEGMFSTGGSAAGLALILEDKDGNILKKMKMDEFGEAVFEKPAFPYTIFLDGGPGHRVRQEGP